MAPAQPLPTDDEGGKPKIVVKLEETDGDSNQKKDQNGSRLVCRSNFEDSGLYGDSTDSGDRLEGDALDQEVDVVGFGDCEVADVEKGEDPDATEHSSSFGNTFSGSEGEARMSLNDIEVDSQFSLENGEQPVSDGPGRLLKKKKVTDQWQRFISPLMWRCQWLELRMNALRSQALLYDKELAAYKHEKQLQSKMIELDDSVSRSVPRTCQSHRKRAMKRRKRKRIEDRDILSYMKKHHIFSYYENDRSETDCQAVKNNCDNEVDEDDKSSEDYETILQVLNRRDSSLEKILLDLDSIQTRVLSLRSQLDDVMKRNPLDASYSAANFFQGDPSFSYARSPGYSPGKNGDVLHHHGSEYELEEPGSAASSYGDDTDVDVMECTAGLFSSDAPLHHRHRRDLHKDIIDDVLINNQAAEEELKNFEKGSHSGVKLEVAKEEAQSCSEDAKTAPRVPAMAATAAGGSGGQHGRPPVLKPCYTGKKRGRKPKRKRRGGFTSGLKSERIQRRRMN